MDYCTTFKRTCDKIHNVFDGEHYNKLCRKYVIVDGVKLHYQYFQIPATLPLHSVQIAICYSKVGEMD